MFNSPAWWNRNYVFRDVYLALSGKKIGLRERQLIMIDHNQSNLSGVVYLIKEIVKILLLIQIVGAVFNSLFYGVF